MMSNNSGCILDCSTTVPQTYNLMNELRCVEDCFSADNDFVTPVSGGNECIN